MKWVRERRSTRSLGTTAVLRWHRRIGLGLAAVFVVIIITGLLLNHGEGLDLRGKRITADWLLDWYGMEPENPPVGYRAGDDWIVSLNGTVFFNESIATEMTSLIGVVSADALNVAAASDEVALISSQGELVERLTSASLPPGVIEQVGLLVGNESSVVVLQTTEGLYFFGGDFLEWNSFEAQPTPQVAWSSPVAIPQPVIESVLDVYRGRGISVHRVILDLHSGRFFGGAGVILVDIAAVGLLILVLTGVWYALRVRPGSR